MCGSLWISYKSIHSRAVNMYRTEGGTDLSGQCLRYKKNRMHSGNSLQYSYKHYLAWFLHMLWARVHKHEHPFQKPVPKTCSTHLTFGCVLVEITRFLDISIEIQSKVKWVERVFRTGFWIGCSGLCTPIYSRTALFGDRFRKQEARFCKSFKFVAQFQTGFEFETNCSIYFKFEKVQ